MDDFYRDYLIELGRNPHNYGHLEHPDAAFEDLNPTCGDRIRIELKLDASHRIADIKFSGRGCMISQASTSMLTDAAKGLPVEDVMKLSHDLILENLGGSILPARMKCATLGLKVLKSAVMGEVASWPDEST